MGLEDKPVTWREDDMTNYEWKQTQEALKDFYGIVKLKIDGYEVSLRLERIDQFKNAIMIYVDGTFSIKQLTEDSEERRRFFCKRTRSILNKKEKVEMMKGLSKKQKVELEQKSKYEYYVPYWTSFRSMKKHLIENNKNIELIEFVM